MFHEGDITTTVPVYNHSLDADVPGKIVRLNAFLELTKLHSVAARIRFVVSV